MLRIIAVIYLCFVPSVWADDGVAKLQATWLESLIPELEKVSDAYSSYATHDCVMLLGEHGRCEQAESLALKPRSAEEQDRLLMGLAVAEARGQHFDDALATAAKVSNASGKDKALQLVGAELARSGQLDRANNLAASITEAGYRYLLVSALCEALAKKGDVELARKRAKEIEDEPLRARTLTTIESIQQGTGTQLESLKLPMRDYVRASIGFALDNQHETLIAAIVAAQAMNRDKALKLLTQANKDPHADLKSRGNRTLAILKLVALAELQDSAMTTELINKFFSAADHDWTKVVSTFGHKPLLLRALVQLNRTDAVEAILKAERKRYKADPSSSSYLEFIRYVAAAEVEFGKIEQLQIASSKRILRTRSCTC